jgi:hypothetical protein
MLLRLYQLVLSPCSGGKVSKKITAGMDEGQNANCVALYPIDHAVVSDKEFSEGGILILRHDPP